MLNSKIAADFKAIALVINTISLKMAMAADGFEEFQVRGSALRHIKDSLKCISEQFELMSTHLNENNNYFCTSNFILIGALFNGCSFQMKHFSLALRSDQHHMVPMCGAHNPRSPIAESGYLWEGIGDTLLYIPYETNELCFSIQSLGSSIKDYSYSLAKYRESMEKSAFIDAANHLEDASKGLAIIAELCREHAINLMNL